MSLIHLFTILSVVPEYSVLAFTPTSRRINSQSSSNPSRTHTRIRTQPQILTLTNLNAKRRKPENPVDNPWYDAIDDNATPSDVFWSEMERQRSVAGVGPADSQEQQQQSTSDDPFRAMTNPVANPPPMDSSSAPSAPGPNEERATEKALANYADFMVDDNWLDEEYAQMMNLQDVDLDTQDADLERQFSEWEKEDEQEDGKLTDIASLASTATEPWDNWSDGLDTSTSSAKKMDDDDDDSELKINLEKGEYHTNNLFIKRFFFLFFSKSNEFSHSLIGFSKGISPG